MGRVFKRLLRVVLLLSAVGAAKSSVTTSASMVSAVHPAVHQDHDHSERMETPVASVLQPPLLHHRPPHESVAFHRQAYERVTTDIAELEKAIDFLQTKLAAVDADINAHWTKHADAFERVTKSSLPSPRGARMRNLRCMGWKSTIGCQWRGQRDASGDQSCGTPITDQRAGYCLVHDDDTGDYFRVMRSDCGAISPNAYLWCEFASAFANFPAEIERVILDAHDNIERKPSANMNGIVVLVEPTQEPLAEALVRALRSHNCQLPVELWAFEDDDLVSALANKLMDSSSIVTTRTMEIKSNWYQARVHAIAHSDFDNVLYLDAATIPLRDPTFLFSLPEYVKTGALFWSDLFHPGTTESNIQPSSLLWELLDMPFVNIFEQDDRQLLIRRDTLATKRALRLVDLFATHSPSFFVLLELVSNNKDFFRLAWLKARASFSMVTVPPSIGGTIALGKFCGTHVVQHDPSGNKVFLHRQRDALDIRNDKEVPVLQSFESRRDPTDETSSVSLSVDEIMRMYHVETFSPIENEVPRCYALRSSADSSVEARIVLTDWALKRADAAERYK